MRRVSYNFATTQQTLAGIEQQYNELRKSILTRFSKELNIEFNREFFGWTDQMLEQLKDKLLTEISYSASFSLLTCVESSLRIDFICRCQLNKKDSLTREFRKNYKATTPLFRYRLFEDIIDKWIMIFPDKKEMMDGFRDAFRFRHWYAHGRYWEYDDNPGKFKYESVKIMVERFNSQMDGKLYTLPGIGRPITN